ncbi:MAG: metal-dependent hydrolase [Planctomycetota bacterium]|jgi:membrane-bound metal-dependent hydrolase YbcI (DUF457 family)
MDAVTHAMSGLVFAAPLAPHAPVTASTFLLGTVLPDLDSLSRLFGRTAFLRWHQTWTHSLAAAALAGLLAWGAFAAGGLGEAWAAPALVAGLLLHALLDFTNTYGMTPLAPFSRRRASLNWVFFVDAPISAVSVGCLVFTAAEVLRSGRAGVAPAAVLAAFLLAYLPLRWALRRRALAVSPAGALDLMPCSFPPWVFTGRTEEAGRARPFRVHALGGRVVWGAETEVLDDAYAAALSAVPEFRIMRELSPGYHVVSAERAGEETLLTCRDLRTRNFGGRFGRLEVVLGPAGEVRRKTLHV